LKRYLTYAILCFGGLAIGVGLWKAHEERFDALAHLPVQDGTVASIDFQALRRAGVLKLIAGRPENEEPEYLSFVKASGFDYQKDLDSVAAEFAPGATYFIVRGRFDWTKLEEYAKANGGSCYERLCHLPGSVPERRISFLPLTPNIMALAVSTDELAAAKLRESTGAKTPVLKDPVWISIPASAFQRTAVLAPGLRVFGAVFDGADRVILTLGGQNDGNFAAHLEALCSSAQTARTIAAQITQINKALKSTAKVQQSNQKVLADWPILKSQLESLAGGL
jgi:hypothetical protein